MSLLEQYIVRNKELEAQVANLHKFLDEVWSMYKLNEQFRYRILEAKAQRWNTALLNVTLTAEDRAIIANGSEAYANRTITPGTEHAEESLDVLPKETGESFGI